MTNNFTSYGSVIKVHEYLATGKPVVIAPLYEYFETPGLRLYEAPNNSSPKWKGRSPMTPQPIWNWHRVCHFSWVADRTMTVRRRYR